MDTTHALFDPFAAPPGGLAPGGLPAAANLLDFDDGDDDQGDRGGPRDARAGCGGGGDDAAAPPPPSPATPPLTLLRGGAERALAPGWRARARDAAEAVRLSRALEADGRAPTDDERARLLLFTGFGASELAQNCFPPPGAGGAYRPGWEAVGEALRAACADGAEHAALRRATQYAHLTPEPLARALWAVAAALGLAAGHAVLEPGCGPGLLLACAPDDLAPGLRVAGVDSCAASARIARLLHPGAEIRAADLLRLPLRLPALGPFDLAVGNVPFSRALVRHPRGSALEGLPPMALHDAMIAAALLRLRPGGCAVLLTATSTLDRADPSARDALGRMADLLAACRLPGGAFAARAGTDVPVDALVLRRRAEGEPPADDRAWLDTAPVPVPAERSDAGEPGEGRLNAWLAARPGLVLGEVALRRGLFGAGLAQTLEGPLDGLGERLAAALAGALPRRAALPAPRARRPAPEPASDRAAPHLREGSLLLAPDDGHTLLRIGASGAAEPVSPPFRAKRDADVARALLPVRDALRETLRLQAEDPGDAWEGPHRALRIAHQLFVQRFGPINRTEAAETQDPRTGETRERRRMPNLDPFRDDPDCWLVAALEVHDPDTDQCRPGPALLGRLLAPEGGAAPAGAAAAAARAAAVETPADALALCLAERGAVDLARVADLLPDAPTEGEAAARLEAAGLAFENPAAGGGGGAWETADEYLSGDVRAKLARARALAEADPHRWGANARALEAVQPPDLRPSEIAARLGAPWLPAETVEAFVRDRLGFEGSDVRVLHSEEFAAWTVRGASLRAGPRATSEWGTERRDARELLEDALNGTTPQIFDVVRESGSERRVFNAPATEAAKERLGRVRDAFAGWVWADASRADRLARIYNERFNRLRVRQYDGSHLPDRLPGMAAHVELRAHQKRAIWRIVSSGSTYVAHGVGAGKTLCLAAAVMEQRRLGLVRKALLAVPGHTLAQWSREWLQAYPGARLLVADERNFTPDRRARFLARAAAGDWDAVIATHSAFALIPVPADFEAGVAREELARLERAAADADPEDRVTRKRVEQRKERLERHVEALAARRDDAGGVTLAELGCDQVLADEAQAMRKLAFATNRGQLKGVDPDGSQRAWDLWVKRLFVERRNPRRALVQASGTPITNTLGEMFSLVRMQDEGLLRAIGCHEFDAWAAAFGETTTELELQPSGQYRPVERFARFVNVPELVDLFRTVADVVQRCDLRGLLRLPAVEGGARRLVVRDASPAFREYQAKLAARIAAIEERDRPPRKGDDILLSVITDGRHAAIDLRLVEDWQPDDPLNKLNALVANVHAIWRETAGRRYRDEDGSWMPIPGSTQMVFSDLGTEAVAAKRGFSAYAWIRDELVRLGVPRSEIAFAQDFAKPRDKARMQADLRAGRVRIAVGSTEVMGTGVNAQNRLAALHHLDAPWLPSSVEQREGRIERQGNQNERVGIFAYATAGSMDATMWQALERKQRFVEAALSGDRSVRHLEDLDALDGQANQFALAKALASGDARLVEKAGLEAEVARLRRQRAARLDDLHHLRRGLAAARDDAAAAERLLAGVREDLARREDTRGDLFRMAVAGREWGERRPAGEALLLRLRAAERASAERDRRPGEEVALGEIGGFALAARVLLFDPEAGPRGGARAGARRAALLLRRAGGRDDRVPTWDDGLTGLGLVARLEHALREMDAEAARLGARLAAARAAEAGYAARLRDAAGGGGADAPWPLEAELRAKEERLAALDAALAAPTQAPARAGALAAA